MVLNSVFCKFKQLPTFFNLGKFKQLPNTCGLEKFKQMPKNFSLGKLKELQIRKFKKLPNTCSLGKTKQLPNGFRTGSLEIQTTIPLFQFREVQSISQSFSTRVFGSSNNCPTVSVGVLGSSNNWLMVLGNGLAKFNQLLNVFSLVSRNKKNSPTTWICVMGSSNNCAQHLCSWEAQTTDQLFRSWDLITSNNCRTVLDSGLGKFKQLPNTCALGMHQSPKGIQLRSLGV